MKSCILLAVVLSVAPAWTQDTVFQDPLGEASKLVVTRLTGMAEGRQGVVGHVDTKAQPVRLYVSMPDVMPGQYLSIQSIGKPIMIDGEEVGREETPAGIVEVERRQNEKLVICKLVKPEPGVEPKVGDAAYLKPVPDSLAVSAFTKPDGSETSLGIELAGRLEQALGASGRFTVVERTRFDALLAEHQLAVSDLFDTTKTAELGQMLQAKGVVIGTIALGDAAFTINVKVVDIVSGVQTASARVDVGATEELRRKYGSAGGNSSPSATMSPDGSGRTIVVNPASSGSAMRNVKFHSAVSTGLGTRLELDFVRAAAQRTYENVSLTEEVLFWTFASKNACYLYADGALLVASEKPLNSLAQLEQLDTDMAAAINLVSQVVPNVTEAEKLGKRFGAARFWADQPGMLHRIYYGHDNFDQVTEQNNWVMTIPEAEFIAARANAFKTGTGSIDLQLRGQRLTVFSLNWWANAPAALASSVVDVASLRYGQHAFTWQRNGGGAGFWEFDVITGSTDDRFVLTGVGADRAKIIVNGLISEIFPGH